MGSRSVACASTRAWSTASPTRPAAARWRATWASCDRCALSVLATVVSHAAPDRAVVDAGAKALTLDRGAHGLELLPGYGQARGRGDITIAGLSEEHGWLRLERSTAGDLAVGTRLEITPNHACTVVNCFDTATVIRDGAVVAQWAVAARGRMS
jgi:D-serine deaminase-like pyridoxal phosphate-dependent protein